HRGRERERDPHDDGVRDQLDPGRRLVPQHPPRHDDRARSDRLRPHPLRRHRRLLRLLTPRALRDRRHRRGRARRAARPPGGPRREWVETEQPPRRAEAVAHRRLAEARAAVGVADGVDLVGESGGRRALAEDDHRRARQPDVLAEKDAVPAKKKAHSWWGTGWPSPALPTSTWRVYSG